MASKNFANLTVSIVMPMSRGDADVFAAKMFATLAVESPTHKQGSPLAVLLDTLDYLRDEDALDELAAQFTDKQMKELMAIGQFVGASELKDPSMSGVEDILDMRDSCELEQMPIAMMKRLMDWLLRADIDKVVQRFAHNFAAENEVNNDVSAKRNSLAAAIVLVRDAGYTVTMKTDDKIAKPKVAKPDVKIEKGSKAEAAKLEAARLERNRKAREKYHASKKAKAKTAK